MPAARRFRGGISFFYRHAQSGRHEPGRLRFVLILALAGAGKIAEANQFNIDVLRPAHDRYMDAVDDAANFVERKGIDLRARYAEDSRLFTSAKQTAA